MPNPLNPIFRQPRESSQQRPKGLRHGKIRGVSPKRRKALALYSKLRAAFLIANPYCQYWLAERGILDPAEMVQRMCAVIARCPPSTDIHHKRKPRTTYLNDTSTWMAVSRQGHDAIEGDKKTARNKGYLI